MLYIQDGNTVLHNIILSRNIAKPTGNSDILLKILLSDEKFTDQINAKDNVSDNIILHVTN